MSQGQPVTYARDWTRDAQQYLSALTLVLLQLFELRLVYEPVDSLTVAYSVRQFLIHIYLSDPAP